MEFEGVGETVVIEQRLDGPPAPLEGIPGLDIGTARMVGDEPVEGAMSFRLKNRSSLSDLQNVLLALAKPDVIAPEEGARFDLPEAWRAEVLRAMTELPRESQNPKYDEAEFPDHYVKFLLPGVRHVFPGDRIRITNKIGRAYGFSIENAVVEDTETGAWFAVAVSLYTNPNGVLNDDTYGYEEIADPFFEDLGEVLVRRFFGSP